MFLCLPRIHDGVAQFSTLNPGTADKSPSLLTTVQLPRHNAMAAIWRSTCWMRRPLLIEQIAFQSGFSENRSFILAIV